MSSFFWLCASVLQGQDSAQDSDFFELHIRPLLVERCQSCHGEAKQWAGLRLDSSEAMMQGGESGPAINLTNPTESELLARIASADASVRMPPPESGAPLSPENVRHFKHWIESGAKWPPSDPSKPKSNMSLKEIEQARSSHWAFQPLSIPEVPKIANSQSTLQPVDAFVSAKLDRAGLSMSAPADRRTLIRRATYDLTGLPPTYEEVEAFVGDPSQDAYERLIDRLLASPRYGEKWGRLWLDIARYSDTKGYVYGREERFFIHASMYRDWVIQAFNEDMRYDQFLLHQLAADCVASDKPSELAAMGFLTVGRRFLGVTPDIMDDRIDVVCRGLMGLTVGCARCHDHKYDPIPTADYYSLYGVFQNSIEREIAATQSETFVPADFINGIRDRQKKYDDYLQVQCNEAEARFRKRVVEYLLAQRELDKYPELTFNQLSTKEDLLPGVVHRWEAYLENARQKNDPIFSAWNAFANLKDEEFATKCPDINAGLLNSGSKIHPRFASAFADPPKSAQDVAERYGKIFQAIEKTWSELLENAKRDGLPLPTSLTDPDDEAIRQAFFGPDSPCVVPRESMANIEWLWDNATVVELWRLQGEIDRWLLQNPNAEPHYVALVDQKTLYEPRIFKRGNPANKGAVVPRQFLTAVAGSERKPFQNGSGRLELAQAVIDPNNPLTARVWVNRVWQNHFGKGLVDTPSDFGVRAQPPTHPELLDWLASKFIENNWSTRWLHRTIMRSAAYQQSSRADLDLSSRAAETDPENRLLWRMNARRLSFEEMRDTMVAVSNEVDWTMGGKATDLFSPYANGKYRRAIYGLVDRQYLPTVFNVFDFANPDLHSPQRNETTVPQQALFQLNHPFVAGRARAIATRAQQASSEIAERIRHIFLSLYQRVPSQSELEDSISFLNVQSSSAFDELAPYSKAWSYGYGAIDEAEGRVGKFEALPYSNATLWQGGLQLPDGALGWVHIGSQTIHSGNDKAHSAIRRWTAPESGAVVIRSEASHDHPQGDGARGVIISSRHGILKSQVLFNSRARFDVDSMEVQAGDTIDFIVELHETLSYEDLTWAPSIKLTPTDPNAKVQEWDAAKNFRTSDSGLLSPLEQLVQVLLIANESMFLD